MSEKLIDVLKGCLDVTEGEIFEVYDSKGEFIGYKKIQDGHLRSAANNFPNHVLMSQIVAGKCTIKKRRGV